MSTEWYTVPREYGGRSFPLRQRLYIEWIWRRHGRAGLDRMIRRRTDRLAAVFREMGKEADRAATEITRTFEGLARTFEEGKDADGR